MSASEMVSTVKVERRPWLVGARPDRGREHAVVP